MKKKSKKSLGVRENFLTVAVATLINGFFSATLVNGSVIPIVGYEYQIVYSDLQFTQKWLGIFLPVYIFQIFVWHYLRGLGWKRRGVGIVLIVGSILSIYIVHFILPYIL